jgi:ArsR family transcriptional regulator, arsenate/arsenite/antimonite-responsive transcriptional repressor
MESILPFFRALADPTRWRIVRLALEEALCVCELADVLEMPQSSVSSHVQVIRKAGLLDEEKCEKWTYFRIARRYQPLIQQLESFFNDSENPIYLTDASRKAKRLAKRTETCCPGPTSFHP